MYLIQFDKEYGEPTNKNTTIQNKHIFYRKHMFIKPVYHLSIRIHSSFRRAVLSCQYRIFYHISNPRRT